MDEIVLVKDLRSDLIEAVIRDLACYTIAFLRLKDVGGACDADLLGSGVLISVGHQRAILTAHHVVHELPTTGRIGLFLGRTTQAHTINTEGIWVVKIARGTQDSVGPDLGAVILAPPIASSIGANKSFFNCARHAIVITRCTPS